MYVTIMFKRLIVLLLMSLPVSGQLFGQVHSKSAKAKTGNASFKIVKADYTDRVHAVWLAQIIAATMGFQFEHKTASTQWIDTLPSKLQHASVDDDWYYEMAAIRAFEKYGVSMTVQQLGRQWLANACGIWGSSEQARLMMLKGIDPGLAGHPRYNKLWFTIGPQFSADVYGAIAPGLPNVAAKMAREYGHINGYAEGVDGGVFMAGMVSLAFITKNPQTIVRKAAQLISPKSPYRKCINMVINMADAGYSSSQIYDEIENRWHIEYPATNNAVANGGIVATSIWFGHSDFLKTINLAYGAADFTDADCNAANAAAVIGAINGTKRIPARLISQLHDRIKGEKLGPVTLTPPVDESIRALAERTASIGKKVLRKNGVDTLGAQIILRNQEPVTQPAELFKLADLTQYWNADWTLERAGFGGAGGGMVGIRGNTYLDGDVLATYPRDEIRGLLLRRTLKLDDTKTLSFDAGVDGKRAWRLEVYVNNNKLINKIITGDTVGRKWRHFKFDLKPYVGQMATIRVYQRVLVPGNAYWKNFLIE